MFHALPLIVFSAFFFVIIFKFFITRDFAIIFVKIVFIEITKTFAYWSFTHFTLVTIIATITRSMHEGRVK